MRARTDVGGGVVPASGTVVVLDASRGSEAVFDLVGATGEVVTFVAEVYLDDRVSRGEVLDGNMDALIFHPLAVTEAEPRMHTISMQVPLDVFDGLSGALWVVIRDREGGVVREWPVRVE